jgi:SAM-dependent methyltransferase
MQGTNAIQESQYLHGTTPAEQERLSHLNELLNGLALREMKLESGARILDVGCGLGQLTRAMARQTGTGGAVIGIERSADQLGEARRLAERAREDCLVEFRHGKAESLPLHDQEWATFDVAHARYLLEHVLDPTAVVREMVRALRPGGRIILEDDAHDLHRLWPEPPGFGRLWLAYLRTFERSGNDPMVGHRLVSLLVQAGAVPRRNTWLFFGACAGQPDLLRAYVDNLIGVLLSVRGPILSIGEYNAGSFDECVVAIRDWSERPDAAYWYAVSWAEGERPSA